MSVEAGASRWREFLDWLYADILDWCRGRSWEVRLLLWLYVAYLGYCQFVDPMSWNALQSLNLPIHEGGHLLFRVFGEFMHVAGGTILQLAAPIFSMVMFLKQRDYFGITFCFGWLSTNFVSMSVYMQDAQRLALPLVSAEGGGDDGIIIHDWHWLFGHMGLLQHCETIGWLVRQLGHLSMLFCLAAGVWLMVQMQLSRSRKETTRDGATFPESKNRR
jgi:hypothetical protein